MILGIKLVLLNIFFIILAITKTTVMAEIIETENSHKKGADFEMLFAEFMKSDLKWDGYVIRSQQKGKSNSRGANVDVIGKRKDDRGRKLYNLGFISAIIGAALVIFSLIDDTDEIFLWGGMIFLGLGILYIAFSGDLHQEHAWVECKNLKGKATIEQMRKCIEEHKDYVATSDKEYKFVRKYFVSASGFVENALKLAMDNNVTCYEYNKNEKFEEVKYWK